MVLGFMLLLLVGTAGSGKISSIAALTLGMAGRTELCTGDHQLRRAVCSKHAVTGGSGQWGCLMGVGEYFEAGGVRTQLRISNHILGVHSLQGPAGADPASCRAGAAWGNCPAVLCPQPPVQHQRLWHHLVPAAPRAGPKVPALLQLGARQAQARQDS